MKFVNQLTTGNLGNTQWTIRRYGCLTACFTSILEVDIHAIAGHAEYYNKDGLLVNPQKLCDDFGGEWNPNRADIGLRPVIVETRFDGLLHFIVWTGDRFYDPLSTNGNPLRDYKIISFRNVFKKEVNMEKGKYYLEPNGTVWYSLDDKKFYLNNESSVNYDGITKVTDTNTIPGELLYPKSRFDQLVATNEMITTLNNNLNANIETKEKQVKDLNDKLVEKDTELTECSRDLKACKNAGGTIVGLSTGQLFMLWFNKLIGKE